MYLRMTGGQEALFSESRQQSAENKNKEIARISAERPPLTVLLATEEELRAHNQRLEALQSSSGGQCVWLKSDS